MPKMAVDENRFERRSRWVGGGGVGELGEGKEERDTEM